MPPETILVRIVGGSDWVVVLILLVMMVSVASRLSTIAKLQRKTNSLLEDIRRRGSERDAFR